MSRYENKAFEVYTDPFGIGQDLVFTVKEGVNIDKDSVVDTEVTLSSDLTEEGQEPEVREEVKKPKTAKYLEEMRKTEIKKGVLKEGKRVEKLDLEDVDDERLKVGLEIIDNTPIVPPMAQPPQQLGHMQPYQQPFTQYPQNIPGANYNLINPVPQTLINVNPSGVVEQPKETVKENKKSLLDSTLNTTEVTKGRLNKTLKIMLNLFKIGVFLLLIAAIILVACIIIYPEQQPIVLEKIRFYIELIKPRIIGIIEFFKSLIEPAGGN